MDKNTIIGLVLISVILLGYMFISRPSSEEKARIQRINDSIAHVQMVKDSLAVQSAKILEQAKDTTIETITDTLSQAQRDSIADIKLTSEYGLFKASANGEEKFTVVENNKMVVTFLNKGGKIYSVELKDYKTYNQQPLILFENGESSTFGIQLLVEGKPLVTNNMYFVPSLDSDTIKVSEKDVKLAMRINASDSKYIEYSYTIKPDDYMMDFDINIVGLQQEIRQNPYVKMLWNVDVRALERGRDWESNNTTIFLRMSDEEIEQLNEMKDEDEFDSKGSAQWIAYKQQFFSSILIAKDNKIDNPTVSLAKIKNDQNPCLKEFVSEFTFDLEDKEKVTKGFSFYFGPNKYSTLKSYDLSMEKIIPLGWGIFGWVNKYAIIPMFNLLGRFISSYGLIILVLTIIIKLVLFPLTYKSYMSSAKMRVLKPQIDALSEKYPKGKEMERQQAQMSLYQRAGVSPMGGCLPLLLQFPILIAMFRFFPASIELRQQPFLWATDLSSYDAIFEWSTNIPLLSSWYGNHISLFALLMAISMLIQQKMTSANQPGGNSMPGMKLMMYLMPVMMLFWFNKYSSGLSYYYLLANIFSILQTWIIQRFVVDEKKVLAQLEANKKKPKTKSKWMQRLEDASKRQQEEMKKRK